MSMITNRELELFDTSERLKTFELWPNDLDCNCTPEKLAEAGFYFAPCSDCPDNVCCVFCGKELDGWEPEDDPLQEHRKHSKNCPFLKMPQPFNPTKLTIEDLMVFAGKVLVERSDKMMKKYGADFKARADSNRKAIENHVLGNS